MQVDSMPRLMNFPRSWVLIKRVDGWLHHDEASFLFHSAAEMTNKKGVIVEIGSYRGRSATAMGLGVKSVTNPANPTEIYCIDPFKPFNLRDGTPAYPTLEEFNENISNKGLSDMVKAIPKKSLEAVKDWKLPIKLLFIDGNHDYDQVKFDYVNWEKHVIDGGIIALHDSTNWDGPQRVVKEFMADKKTSVVRSITHYRKGDEHEMSTL